MLLETTKTRVRRYAEALRNKYPVHPWMAASVGGSGMPALGICEQHMEHACRCACPFKADGSGFSLFMGLSSSHAPSLLL